MRRAVFYVFRSMIPQHAEKCCAYWFVKFEKFLCVFFSEIELRVCLVGLWLWLWKKLPDRREVAKGRCQTEEKNGKGTAAGWMGGCIEAPSSGQQEEAQGRCLHPNEDIGTQA